MNYRKFHETIRTLADLDEIICRHYVDEDPPDLEKLVKLIKPRPYGHLRSSFYYKWEPVFHNVDEHDLSGHVLNQDKEDAWSQLNFGPTATAEGIIGTSLLKVFCMYGAGSGATYLLHKCGLVDTETDSARITNQGFELIQHIISTHERRKRLVMAVDPAHDTISLIGGQAKHGDRIMTHQGVEKVLVNLKGVREGYEWFSFSPRIGEMTPLCHEDKAITLETEEGRRSAQKLLENRGEYRPWFNSQNPE